MELSSSSDEDENSPIPQSSQTQLPLRRTLRGPVDKTTPGYAALLFADMNTVSHHVLDDPSSLIVFVVP
jgi:hypothetical protein